LEGRGKGGTRTKRFFFIHIIFKLFSNPFHTYFMFLFYYNTGAPRKMKRKKITDYGGKNECE
jgi:hypothetical protein